MAILTRVRKANGKRGWGWLGEAIPSACAAAAMMAAGCEDNNDESRSEAADISPENNTTKKIGAFTDVTFEAARAQAAASTPEKVVVVDFTGKWCPPCQTMDRLAWPDEHVVEWLDGNAVAIQVDVQKDPAFTREMDVKAMPTIVVLRGREEIGRASVAMNAEQLLAWLKKTAGTVDAAVPIGS